ncbi:putative ARM repeat-containing protein [Lyophyllum shimeji]|uniref:ARM repeat-containing protein n=1 Tax=Lyophyllum shimeji TaxID=47721 RepID=A0A9P3PQ31_LYOSH|nr:putative ARM repeat-containing protein [Lyophyllum shimeji]
MTVTSITLANLRKVKNTVIGNPSAKLQLARDVFFISNLVDCLNYPKAPSPHDPIASPVDIRIEAAHVIASLSYGSDEALLSLLHANAPQAFLYAIAHFQPDDPPSLRAAFARALRALTVSIADVVGPSQWGLGPESSIAQNDAKDALEHLFQLEALDTLLPLLADPGSSPHTATSIAQLLASAIRARHHRTTVSEWLPPPDRAKEVKTRRGWEKTSAVTVGPARQGGWVARQLTALLKSRDVKLQEAALNALAALAKENPDVANALAKPSLDREQPSPLAAVLTLAKSRSADVQLAACLCATHIIRATARPSIPSLSTPHHPHPHLHHPTPHHPPDETATRTIMNIVNRMISPPMDGFSDIAPGSAASTTGTAGIAQRTRACFVLYHLVCDDIALCQAAFDCGCLAKLVALVTAPPLPSIPPSDVAEFVALSASSGGGAPGGGAMFDGLGSEARQSNIRSAVYTPPTDDRMTGHEEDDEWDEPESVTSLREAALTAIAAISLFDNDVRRALTEPFPSYHGYGYGASFLPPSPPDFSRSSSPPSSSPPHGGNGSPPLLSVLLASLAHPAPGVRYAACQCVRAMSRAVAVLRTNIIDSGLGVAVWRMCVKGQGRARRGKDAGGKDGKGGKAEEDKRVLGAALAAVCNMVNDFSPLRQVLLDDGLMRRLVEITRYDDPALRTSALWAVKNLLCRSATQTKRAVMGELGWARLLRLMEDADTGVREQALNVVRNITENEDGIELVIDGIGGDVLLDRLASALKASNDDVVLQAAYVLANLANGGETHLERILAHPDVLPALHAALTAATAPMPTPTASHPPAGHGLGKAEARRPIVACVSQLARIGPAKIKAAGFEGALRHVYEWVGGGMGGGGRGGLGWEDDREVVEQARLALHWLGLEM